MIESLIQMIQGNQIAQAALVAAPAAALSYSARALPLTVYRGTKKLVSVEVRFNSDNPDFDAITRYVSETIISKRLSRSFNYHSETQWDREACEDEVRHRGLTVGYGTHVGFYRRGLVIVNRQMMEGQQTEKFKESLALTFFTTSKKTVGAFAEEVAHVAREGTLETKHVPLYINSGSWWRRASKLPLRSMDTIFTNGEVSTDLLSALRTFEDRQSEDHRRGLPHHLGVLLYGEPGCGKSSLIHALASEMGRSIYYLNLGAVENDRQLIDLVCSGRDWSKSLLVLEDFDATAANVAQRPDAVTALPNAESPPKPVSLSVMLNILDGLIAPDGLITIATTNHIDRLDDALRRPGRFDHSIELGRMDFDQFSRMATLFGVDSRCFKRGDVQGLTGAEMRSLLMKEAAS